MNLGSIGARAPHALRRTLTTGAVMGLGMVTITACGGGSGAVDEFPTKDILLIEPFAAGGGGDAYSRALAGCFERDLPGELDVIVENRPPAIDGISGLWNSEPDGHTIGSTSLPTIVGMKLSQPEAVPWDPTGFIPLGIAESNGYVVYVAGDSPYQSIEDLQDAEDLKVLLTQPGGGSALATGVAIVTFDLDATQTFGAEGSTDSALAVLRGESDFAVFGASDFPDMVDSGDLRPLLFMGSDEQRSEQYPWLADLPGMDSVGQPEMAGVVSEYRMWSVAPGTPDHAVDYLRELFQNAFDSGCMQEFSDATGRPLLPMSAEDAIAVQKRQTETITELYPRLAEVRTE